MNMTIIPKVKEERILNGNAVISSMHWLFPHGVEERLRSAARELFPDDPAGYPVRVSLLDTESQAYRLRIGPEGAEVEADSAAAAFYAMQSLAMLHRLGDGTIPCREIFDAPDLPFRGFMLDVTRGRVPTLDSLKAIVRQLARYKINKLQIYIENAFPFAQMAGITAPENCLTPEEFRQLDDWCHAHYIELIPTFACFGHLYDLLQDPRYSHLAELPDYAPRYHYWMEKMSHHTLDVSNPDSFALVKSFLDQVFPLFRSNTVNICCDETFDLCKGRNQGKDPAQAYMGFVKKISDYAQACGKQVQLWADIALKHPQIIRKLGGDLTLLNWDYEPEPEEAPVRQLAQAGLRQILCPGIQSWNVFLPNFRDAEKNITSMAIYARKYHAAGMLTTAWGDYGHVCPWGAAVYGMILGAEKSWNCLATPPDEAFRNTVSRMEYGTDSLPFALFEAINAHDPQLWRELVHTVAGAPLEDWEREGVSRENLEAVIDACREAERLLPSSPENPAVSDLLLAVEGTHYTAAMLQRILYGTDCFDASQMHSWFGRYQAGWLRENKPSELWRLRQFLHDAEHKCRVAHRG